MIDRSYQKFKRNRRAMFSLRLFLIIFSAALCANFIANDKPLLIYFNNQFFFPQLSSLNSQNFGDIIPLKMDYNLPDFIDHIYKSGGWIIRCPIPFSYNTIDFYHTAPFPNGPDARHLLGTDAAGHDVVAILLYGLRISILFGVLLCSLSAIIGILIGGLCGYFGGMVDIFGQRLLELWSSLPTLYILIILSSIAQPGFWMLLFIMTLVSWMSVVGVVRAEFFRVRSEDYVTCAQIMGAKHFYIALNHILPNALTATITLLPFLLSGAIVGLSSLDFLGFGLPVDYPSIGKLMLSAKQNLQAPWLSLSAFGVLTVILSLLVFTGEGLRDALDPRHS